MKKTVSLILALLITAAVFISAGLSAAAINGDTNGDRNIDNKDVVTLFRYVSGSASNVKVENCDYNNDGEIDNKDVVMLFRAVSAGITVPDTTEPEPVESITDPEPTAEETEEESSADVPNESSDEISDDETTTDMIDPDVNKDLVVWKPTDSRCAPVLIYDKTDESVIPAEATMFKMMIKNYTGARLVMAASPKTYNNEIILSSNNRAETKEMLDELSEGEYAVRVTEGENDGEGKLLIAATTYESCYACVEYLLETYYSEEEGIRIPYGLDIKGSAKNYRLIESSLDKKMRDPFILVENGVYYAYATSWKCFKNTSGNLEGSWKKVNITVTLAHPETDGGSHWAPEVHKYNGSYYMFTTYLNSETNHRGCSIFKADSPEGPFVEITDGHITPDGWDAIDGTFYVDPDGQPWMVFVHEWTSMPDKVGSFAAAKLSDDLTHFISEPIELFKANEPKWATANITDGCFMYTTKDKELLMLWSNFDSAGYNVAVARSSNGRLDGEWTHENTLLYSKLITNTDDGGHGMIFTDTDGQMYLTFHSPQTIADGDDRKEKMVFLAIEEKDGKLVRSEFEDTGDE